MNNCSFASVLIIYLGWSYWQFKKYQDLTTAASPATTESFYTEDGKLEINKVRALSRSYAQAIAGMSCQILLIELIISNFFCFGH